MDSVNPGKPLSVTVFDEEIEKYRKPCVSLKSGGIAGTPLGMPVEIVKARSVPAGAEFDVNVIDSA
jgi:hypothetical protein